VRVFSRPAATALGLLVAVMAIPTSACPFCGAVGESLAGRRDRAACVAIGDAEGISTRGPAGLPVQAFRVVQVITGVLPDSCAADAAVVARVPGPVVGTALLFADASAGWSAIAADEALIGHVVGAPAPDTPAPHRLRWFIARLEHPHPAIAADAFTELGLASYAAVRATVDAFDGGTLRRWIADPAVDQRRRGFYGLALGLVAATTSDAGERDAARVALHEAITSPADDFRAGFDGLLGGLLVADGPAGLDTLGRLGLLAATARPVDQRHVLAALRFAWEELADTLPRNAVAAATARLLAAPVVAADATIDLARYGHWAAVDEVADLWEALGDDDPLVRRAVAGYLAACPLPAARAHLDAIRRRDARRLSEALAAAALPLGR
jgi:hypothetical protein